MKYEIRALVVCPQPDDLLVATGLIHGNLGGRNRQGSRIKLVRKLENAILTKELLQHSLPTDKTSPSVQSAFIAD